MQDTLKMEEIADATLDAALRCEALAATLRRHAQDIRKGRQSSIAEAVKDIASAGAQINPSTIVLRTLNLRSI